MYYCIKRMNITAIGRLNKKSRMVKKYLFFNIIIDDIIQKHIN